MSGIDFRSIDISVLICIFLNLDDGLKENVLYVSADTKVDEKPEDAVYAAVNKNVPGSNNNANVYAEVKKSGQIVGEKNALYTDVKPKKGTD